MKMLKWVEEMLLENETVPESTLREISLEAVQTLIKIVEEEEMEKKFEKVAKIKIDNGVVTEEQMGQIENILKPHRMNQQQLIELRNSFVKWHSENFNNDEDKWDEAAYQVLSGTTAVIDYYLRRTRKYI